MDHTVDGCFVDNTSGFGMMNARNMFPACGTYIAFGFGYDVICMICMFFECNVGLHVPVIWLYIATIPVEIELGERNNNVYSLGNRYNVHVST